MSKMLCWKITMDCNMFKVPRQNRNIEIMMGYSEFHRFYFDVKKVFVVLFDQKCCAIVNNLGFIGFAAAFKKRALDYFDRW